MTLDAIAIHTPMRVTHIDWAAIDPAEGHRLRSLGLDEGSIVELLHRGMLFWKDPLAVKVGRMTIAMRSSPARAIICAPLSENSNIFQQVTAG